MIASSKSRMRQGRSPYGERGLKFVDTDDEAEAEASLSLRRAWIEINQLNTDNTNASSRSPYGERGLK